MDISQAFTALNGRFADTVNSHDTPSWVALFAEDAILIPAGQEAVTGRKGIEEWAEVATKIWNHLEIQQGLCTSDGNVAWESGTYRTNGPWTLAETSCSLHRRKAPRCASKPTPGT